MASLVTRCPACATLFKVVPDQLRISEGWVRCGQCDEVFDAQAQMQPQVVLAPEEAPEAPALEASNSLPPPLAGADIGLNASPAPVPCAEDLPDAGEFPVSSVGADTPATVSDMPAPPSEETAVVEPSFTPSPNAAEGAAADAPAVQASFLQQASASELSGPSRWILRVVLLLAVLALLGQVAIHQRDRIAATEPALTGVLDAVCRPIGCQVAPLQHIESIVIESSSFIKVRADVYRLAFSLKNTALVPLALPSAELALTDLRDQSVVRRVLSSQEYGARAATLGPGEELSVVVPVAVKATGAASDKVTGYRLLVFYP